MMSFTYIFFFFFFNDTATTEIYTLSLHDALPIFNWVKGIDPKTGELIGRNPPRLGKPHFICPWIAGGRGWESGSYNPQTGLWDNTAVGGCEEGAVAKQTPGTEAAARRFFGGGQGAQQPPRGEGD